MGSPCNTAFATTNMDHLARIFFHVDSLDTHVSNVAILCLGNIAARFTHLQIIDIYAFFCARAIDFQI